MTSRTRWPTTAQTRQVALRPRTIGATRTMPAMASTPMAIMTASTQEVEAIVSMRPRESNSTSIADKAAWTPVGSALNACTANTSKGVNDNLGARGRA